MSIIGTLIDDHITINNEAKKTQRGFTKHARIEDNFVILQHCIEDSFQRRKPLIVTSINDTKNSLQ